MAVSIPVNIVRIPFSIYEIAYLKPSGYILQITGIKSPKKIPYIAAIQVMTFTDHD